MSEYLVTVKGLGKTFVNAKSHKEARDKVEKKLKSSFNKEIKLTSKNTKVQEVD